MLITLVAGLYGLVIGSFVNALVWRINVGKSIADGRSMCPHCKHELAAIDLIPVLSWVLLRGKCRYCHKPISIQYPLVELMTGVLFALSYAAKLPHGVNGWSEFIIWLIVLSAGIALVVYDLRWYILPDLIVVPATALVLLALVAGRITGVVSPEAVTSHAGAALVAGGVFFALASIAGGKLMGGGDVKLAFLMGLVLGGTNTIVAMMVGFNSAAIVGVSLIAVGIKKRKDYIPFGPFLVAGMVVAYLYGPQIVSWYTNLIERIVI